MSLIKDPIKWSIGLKNNQIDELISKIVIALPDGYFEEYDNKIMSQINALIAKEFIMFQVQENMRDPNYVLYLENFIYDLNLQIHFMLEVAANEGDGNGI